MSLDKLYRKYAGSPIRPPHPDDEVEVSIPTLGKPPVIKELSEKEMKDWEDFISEKKLLKDLDITKEKIDIGDEEKAGQEEGTMPAIPKKKSANLSADTLLKMCSQYHILCSRS